ncbi:NUDIX hydrolase [Bacillus cereus]|uniref:NUDIX hydrolase n=1 Tax=Bacillus cereus TaxID=1396 RepID=A0ABD7DCR8_BACCE|nr:NUDIX domain-containing protein [Bacillus cereus]QRY14682.1 NUDIX hydrolase [Bacillus cereus]
MEKRGKVWLAVSGLVAIKDGRWLFVKKKYSGLKGKWSLPAGFVNEGETVDEAVKREVLEETGIVAHVKGIIGVRSGVIRDEISDNMIIFLLEPEGENIIVQEKELSEVAFLHPDKIADDPNTSVLIKYLLEGRSELHLEVDKTLNPGESFGYTAYHVFTARAKEREKE